MPHFSRVELAKEFKPGMKIKRVSNPNSTMGMIIGKIYVIASIKEGWLKLKGDSNGHAWHPKYFSKFINN